MAVQTYRPQLSVVLSKNIGRATVGGNVAASQRFQGAKRAIDLAPFLGDIGSVVVEKSTREPAGMFSITLADRLVQDEGDSLYGLVEPMDVVEIRMARDVTKYGGSQLPITMRGFVTDVRRDLVMTERGPQRVVTISGQDYGKILQIIRIIYLAGMNVGQDLLSSFKLFLNYGVDAEASEDAADFIGSVVDNVVTPFIQKMQQSASSGTSTISLIGKALTSGSGIVSAMGAQEFGGEVGGPGFSIYDLMRYFGDVGPWNELFVEDQEQGPVLVFRPTPFKDIDGNLIQANAKAPAVIDVTDSDLVGLSAGRSDSDVANYFWVHCPTFLQLTGSNLEASAFAEKNLTPKPYVEDYPNVDPKLYGIRPMQATTQNGARLDGKSKDKIEAGEETGFEFLNKKRDTLIKQNRDNIVLERGSLRLKGNETVKAGCYVRLARGADSGFKSEYYAFKVRHEFAPMRGFFTTADFERGTGFIERAKRDGGASAPYFAEMSLGGAYA